MYTATGVKLQVIHETDMNLQAATVMATAPFSTQATDTKTTDYVGNKVYENGTLKRTLIDGGYIEGTTYHFFLTDHLGNNRVVAKADGTVIQKNHYYPFGMAFAENTTAEQGVQPYKYNGKELDQMHGLNMYDYSARFYEPGIGRFSMVDPLAEKYYSISPYAYVANNPLKYIDTDGRKISIANNPERAMTNLAKIAATNFGGQIISHLIGQNETYTLNSVFLAISSDYNHKSRTISYVGNTYRRYVEGGTFNSMIAMGHETMHGYDHSINLGGMFRSDAHIEAGASTLEGRAVSFGNYLREIYSLDSYRNSYGSYKENFFQFSTKGTERVSDFTSLGNNADKTSYGFSYTKTISQNEKDRFGFTTKSTVVSQKTYYIIVGMDKDKNATYKIYNSEDEYKKAVANW